MLSVNVLTWHNDAGRTGLNSNEQILNATNVNSTSFGELYSYPVTGQVYAQPLYVSNLAIPGKGTHNVLFVVTQNNDVYAFDANSNTGVTAGVLWHVNLGLAAAMPNTFFGNRYGPYHDINPQVGITSTPVIDLVSGTLYLDAFTNDVAGQDVFSHHIHALDITTGQEKVTPVLVAAAVKGNGVGGDGTTVTFDAEHQLQRPALSLLNGVLYVTYGAFADSDPYHGWILGFDATTLALKSVFNSTPNLLTTPSGDPAGEGGIWQGGAGLASDGSSLMLMVGNGDFDATIGDYGDSILKVSPDASTQAAPNVNGYGTSVSDFFTPFNQQQLSDADEDLGSGGGLVVPTPNGPFAHEFIGAGKQGRVYVINLDNMGKFSATGDNVIQRVDIGNGAFSSPAYFNSAVYFHAVGDVLKKFVMTNGLLSPAPSAQTSTSYGYPGATPSISSDGTANGIVWDAQYDTHETLHAYDANTLAELYNSNQNAARDQLPLGVKFVTPTIADGQVYLGLANSVAVFGLLMPATTVPNAPSNLTAAAASASSVMLHWVDNANQEAGVKIERSTDNVSFTQIALASANSTAYTDSTVAANTLYYYRIRSTNVIGDSACSTPASVTTPSGTNAINVYHFDSGTGTTAVDSAGINSGTLVGGVLPQWTTPGKLGGAAISFSGDGTYNQTASQSAVKVANDLSTILGSTSTLDVWINTTQVGNNVHWKAPAITGVEQAAGANDINWGSIDGNGRIGLWVGDSGSVFSKNAINDGQWHNVAMTRDATTGLVQLFVDGVLNSSATLETGNKTTPFTLIGALSDVAVNSITPTGNNFFNGTLDEVRIYQKVLGQSEVSALATIPAAPVLQSVTVAAGPVAHLVFSSPSAFSQSIEIDRMTGTNGSYVPIATLAGGATVYDDTTVTPGVTYCYVVKAIDAAGSSPASNMLSVTPPVPTVIGNYVFYNNSKFDGNNGSSNLTDTTAIATDKVALLPGQTASFANVTNYSNGINGVIIDVANMSGLPRVDDFTFLVGNDNNPANWVAAPYPTYINSYPGRGPGGSTQITLIWADHAIQNQWLQVTMFAQPHLGLAADDVFYFGNAVGETGDTATDALVTTSDAARVTANFASSATVTNGFDINRDGAVNAADVSLVTPTTKFNGLNLISLTGTAPGKPASLTAVAGTGQVTLNWTTSSNATGYNIYRGMTAGGEGNTPIATGIVGASYVDTGLVSGNYCYFVTAVNAALSLPAAESARSAEAVVAVSAFVKLTGTPIGTTTSWAGTGDTIAQVFDGNLNTYFDAPASGSLTSWAGLDLGSPQQITQIKFAPRSGFAYRMVGGQFQASSTPDFSSNVVNLYTVAAAPVVGQLTTIAVNPGANYRYVRYVGGNQWVNIAEMEVDGIFTAPPASVKIPGTPIGSQTSWAGVGDTVAQASDGNLSTFFDAANGNLSNWAGLDMGVPQTITQIKYAPRAGFEYRMVGGQFQVSSTVDFSANVVTLYTVVTTPVAGQLTTVFVNPGGAYRYVRFVGGTAWVNFAEMEVDGIYTAPPVAGKLTGTVIGTPTSWAGTGDTIQQVFDGTFSTFYDAANSNLNNWVGLDLGSARNITQIKYAPRAGSEYRMIGGQFQVSSTADFSSNVITLYTVAAAPVAGQFTTVGVSPGAAYRYVRFVGGNQWVNIAEMEVDGL